MKNISNIAEMAEDSIAPTRADWVKTYNDFIMPTYQTQPLIARQFFGEPLPLDWDGKNVVEYPKINDISDPIYDMLPQETNDVIDGSKDEFPTPQFSKSMQLTREQWKKTFAGADRLKLWLYQVIPKIAEFEDKVAFQGKASLKVYGAIGANSTDLGAPSGKWDVDTASIGVLDKARDDLIKVKNHFVSNGLGDRPITIAITTPIATLLTSTYLANTNGLYSNWDLWMKTLPEGSKILVSDNIQAGVDANTNSMVACVEKRGPNEKMAYAIHSTGIRQVVNNKLWGTEYGVQEKFTVNVGNDKFVCYMDGIDTTT